MKKLLIAICTLHTAICTLLAGAAAKDCYVRFNFTQLAGGTQFQLSELKLFNSQGMRINTGMTAFTSTTDATNLTEKSFINPYSATSYEWAGNLFDGNTGTKVCQTKTLPHLFTMRLAAGAYPVAYNFTSADDSFGSRSPVRWTVEASTNGVDWTTVDDKTNANQPYPTTQFTDYNGGTPYAFEYPWVGFKAAVVQSSVMYVPGTPAQPAVIVTNYFTANALTEGTDYTLAYSNNTAIGTGTVTIKGLNAYAGDEWSLNFAIVPGYTISLASATVVYDFSGGGAKASVTVRDGVNATKVLTEGTDYELVYANNEDIGTAKVTANGLGDYLGQSASANFTVVSLDQKIPARYAIIDTTAPTKYIDRISTCALYDGGYTDFIEDPAANRAFLLDFGTPRHIRLVGIAPRADNNLRTRSQYFKAWGSNNLTEWTLVHTNSTLPEINKMNLYLVSEGLSLPAFRYLKVGNIISMNICELAAYSDDLMVEATADAGFFASTAIGAADADGVTIAGKLTCSIDGPSMVCAFAAGIDYDDNYAAWSAHGRRLDFGQIEDQGTFSGKLTGLSSGRWYWRIFAIRGNTASACQPVSSFAIGSRVVYPRCYVKNNTMQKVSDGVDAWIGDLTSDSWAIFDFKDCDLMNHRLEGLRIYGRAGFYARTCDGYCDFGYDPADGTAVDWGETTRLVEDAAGWVVDQVTGVPANIIWTSDIQEFVSASVVMPQVLYAPFTMNYSQRKPRYVRLRDFYQTNIGEFEFRVIRSGGTTVICY